MLLQWERALVFENNNGLNELHIAGDFNLDSLNEKWLSTGYSLKSLANMVLTCCSTNNLSQLVTEPTRIQYNSVKGETAMSCIDHVYSTAKHRVSDVKVLSFGASDHNIIMYTRYSKEPIAPSRT